MGEEDWSEAPSNPHSPDDEEMGFLFEQGMNYHQLGHPEGAEEVP